MRTEHCHATGGRRADSQGYRRSSQQDLARPFPLSVCCDVCGQDAPPRPRCAVSTHPVTLTWRHRWTRPPRGPGTQPPPTTDTDLGRLCAQCGLRSPPGSTHGALLPDATVIDPRRSGPGRPAVRHRLRDRAPAGADQPCSPRLGRRTTMVRPALPSQHPTSHPRPADVLPRRAGPAVPRAPAPRGTATPTPTTPWSRCH